MQSNNNKVILIGELAGQAEGFLTKAGVQGARLRVATTSTWNDGGEDKSVTDFHRVILFGEEATQALDLQKGQHLEVEGRLQTRSYTGKDGVKRYETSVVAQKIRLSPDTEAQAA